MKTIDPNKVYAVKGFWLLNLVDTVAQKRPSIPGLRWMISRLVYNAQEGENWETYQNQQAFEFYKELTK